MNIKDFKKNVKKVSGERNTIISKSYGNNHAWNFYKSITHPQSRLSSTKFRTLVNKVNALMAEDFINTGITIFPLGLGELNIKAKERKPKIKNGKLEYNAPIDWNKTLELWATDPESRVAKTLIKMPPGVTYRIHYRSAYRNFKNKMYMQFAPTRAIKMKLKERIISGEPLTYVNIIKLQ